MYVDKLKDLEDLEDFETFTFGGVCEKNQNKDGIVHIHRDLFEWLDEYYNEEDYVWNKRDEFYFRNEEDALAFKLTWT